MKHLVSYPLEKGFSKFTVHWLKDWLFFECTNFNTLLSKVKLLYWLACSVGLDFSKDVIFLISKENLHCS